MSDIPKEVWCRPYLSYDYVEDWFDGSWSNINKGGVKYVRSDRIEQLAAINEEMEAKLQHQTDLIEQFFALLDKVEQTDDGCSFHPNQLRSCRTLDAEKLNKILAQLKNMVEGNNT